MSREFDPTRLEVIRNALEGIADTMAISLYQTARSAVVRLGWDFSTAVLTAEGDLVGQGMCHPIHLGGMAPALAGCLAFFGEDIEPGDLLVINDPYEGAQHLPDIYLFRPVFHDGALLAHVGAVCHHADIGGSVPGGQGFANTEIHQEGLRIPPSKLHERGTPNETIHRLLEKAVRVPDTVLGDLLAQVTATRIGERELLALVERIGGIGEYRALVADLLDHTERLTRRAIAELPDGTWSFTDHVDDDGISDDTIAIVATVTKTGDEIHVGFDGTSPQCRGSIVGLFHMNTNFVHMALRSLLGADLPSTSGFFRPITITAPPGCFVNPLPPAAVAARQLGGRRINQAVWGALARMAPERAFACPGGADSSIAFSGLDKTREPWRGWVLTEGFNEIACGGRPDKDGMEGQGSNITNQANTPVELLELEYPIRIDEYGFVPDTEGPGRYRGGLAMSRTYTFLDDGIEVRVRSDRTRHPPWGVEGGGSAPPPRVSLEAGGAGDVDGDGAVHVLAGKSTTVVRRGERLHTRWCGGGGHGPPLHREPERVLRDVVEEKITPAHAREAYGVVVDPSGRAVDRDATEALRAARAGPTVAGAGVAAAPASGQTGPPFPPPAEAAHAALAPSKEPT